MSEWNKQTVVIATRQGSFPAEAHVRGGLAIHKRFNELIAGKATFDEKEYSISHVRSGMGVATKLSLKTLKKAKEIGDRLLNETSANWECSIVEVRGTPGLVEQVGIIFGKKASFNEDAYNNKEVRRT